MTYTEYSWNGSQLVGTEKSVTAPIFNTFKADVSPGVYYLDSTLKYDMETHYRLQGDVSLVLCDGANFGCDGIYVPTGATLKIFASGNGTGKLQCFSTGTGAGIGGDDGKNNGNIEIHGGVVEAEGHDHCAGIGSNSDQSTGSITIYNGNVTATGGKMVQASAPAATAMAAQSTSMAAPSPPPAV